MAIIHKVSFYLVSDEMFVFTEFIKNKIYKHFPGVIQQLHVEESVPFETGKNPKETMPNCDLADLEKHFDHGDKFVDVVVGGIYKHFKGHEVKVLAVSRGTEYGEWVVVYEHLGDHTVWHRPVEMFTSEVDHEKYPEVKQQYRFQLIG